MSQRTTPCQGLWDLLPNITLIKSQQPNDANFMPAGPILRDGGTIAFPPGVLEAGNGGVSEAEKGDEGWLEDVVRYEVRVWLARLWCGCGGSDDGGTVFSDMEGGAAEAKLGVSFNIIARECSIKTHFSILDIVSGFRDEFSVLSSRLDPAAVLSHLDSSTTSTAETTQMWVLLSQKSTTTTVLNPVYVSSV